ncbi:MAG: DUF4235 domain-containing protein [Nitriliruptoraceae bacterium]
MQLLLRKLVAAGAAAGAAVLARRVVEFGWGLARDEPPPTAADAGDDTQLRDLLLWSALVAGAVALAQRLAVSRTDRLLGADED